jgi:hypothetical protein
LPHNLVSCDNRRNHAQESGAAADFCLTIPASFFIFNLHERCGAQFSINTAGFCPAAQPLLDIGFSNTSDPVSGWSAVALEADRALNARMLEGGGPHLQASALREARRAFPAVSTAWEMAFPKRRGPPPA